METIGDALFRASYEGYATNHDRLRAELLAKLPAKLQRSSQSAARGWRLISAGATLAVILLVIGGIASLSTLRPQQAYGLADVRQRLQAVQSLYVKGWIYERTQTKFGTATVRFPVQHYYKRPSTCYMVSYGFSSGGNDDLKKVTKITMANDDKRSMVLVEPEKKAIVGPTTDLLQAELMVENGLQVSEIMLLLGSLPEGFEQVGRERVRGQECDIYESKKGKGAPFWRRVWLDPRIGVPARVVVLSGEAGEEPQVEQEYDVIQANVEPPPDLFTFETPEGFDRVEVTEALPVRSIGNFSSGSSGNRSVSLWVAIKLSDKAVLMCWSQSTDTKESQGWFKDMPRIVLEGKSERECKERTLYETMSGSLRWRWSIITPKDEKPVGADSLTLSFSSSGDNMSMGGQPLVFLGRRLPEMVERVQQRSLEESGELKKALSLEQLQSSQSP